MPTTPPVDYAWSTECNSNPHLYNNGDSLGNLSHEAYDALCKKKQGEAFGNDPIKKIAATEKPMRL